VYRRLCAFLTIPLAPEHGQSHILSMTHSEPNDISEETTADLRGKLLIAMPSMGDTRFEKSVIYLCAHSEDGSMGLIINKPSGEVRFPKLLEQLKISHISRDSEPSVYFGGPVEMGRGFVLHSTEYHAHDGMIAVDDNFAMSATLDVLRDIAVGKGPVQSILALGYSGWGSGQLESEIFANGWLTCDATLDLVFETAPEDQWSAALQSLGVDPMVLSTNAGHA